MKWFKLKFWCLFSILVIAGIVILFKLSFAQTTESECPTPQWIFNQCPDGVLISTELLEGKEGIPTCMFTLKDPEGKPHYFLTPSQTGKEIMRKISKGGGEVK